MLLPYDKIKSEMRKTIYSQLCELEKYGYLITKISSKGIKSITNNKKILINKNIKANTTRGYDMNIYYNNKCLDIYSIYKIVGYNNYRSYIKVSYGVIAIYVYIRSNNYQTRDYIYLKKQNVKYNPKKLGILLTQLFDIPYHFNGKYYDSNTKIRLNLGIHPNTSDYQNTKLSNSIYIMSTLFITLIYNHIYYSSKMINVMECFNKK